MPYIDKVNIGGVEYDIQDSNLKSIAIQGLGQNLNSDTGTAICNNDLDNLPRNTVYGLVPYSGLAHMPYTETGSGHGGLLFTLSKEQPANATMTQIILRRDGHIFIRQRWGDYEDWREYKTAAELESVVSDLAADTAFLETSLGATTGYSPIRFIEKHLVPIGSTIGATIDINPSYNNSTDCIVTDCSAGDVFSVTGYGWNSERLWAFVDSSNKLLTESSANEQRTNYRITAPTNAARLIINARRSDDRAVYKIGAALLDHTEFAPTGQNITSSTVSAICSGNANNLPNNNIYGINIDYSYLSNMPFAPRGVNGDYRGTLYTFGKESARGYGDIQYYVPGNNRAGSYVRVYTSSWGEWKNVNEKTWNSVLGIGDSICEGWRNENRGFAGMLGAPYRNLGVTGATLGTASGHTQIYSEIENATITEDLVIADGGINDYYFDVPLGTLPTAPVTDDTAAAALDKTTVSGGLAYLLYMIIKKAPFAQRYFLITHKTRNYPYTQCAAGYTQQDLHDRIVAICKLYNVKVIDVYEESVINSEFAVYCSPTAYSNSNTGVTKEYYVDKDGIHPLWLGYQAGYLPVMMRALERANMT